MRVLALATVVGAFTSCGAGPRTGLRAPTPAARDGRPLSGPLSFSIREGRIDNRFFRDGSIAAHLLVTTGDAPRLVVAFPAGNMGVGAWFEGAADLSIEGAVSGVERGDGMRGVTATVRARAPRLRIARALLGSVRMLRDFSHDGSVPPGMDTQVVAGPPVVLKRTTLDGKHHLELSFEPEDGSSANVDPKAGVSFDARPGGAITLRVTALADDKPLTAVPLREILTSEASDPRALEVLSFLTYEEKLLAGSWQYLTYFGRDTLLSTRLLLPVLKPAVVEAALGAVVERLSPDGEVAHEEDVGEWAVLENMRRSPRPADLRQPLYDRKMVDDDFLLAPVLAAYLETDAGPPRMAAFLARRTSDGRTYADALRKNLDRVLAQAVPFASRATYESLVRIGDGLSVGNWRDSNEGLGQGRYPYDVNVALVPAALRAAERLYMLDALGSDRASSARAAELAAAWSKAEALFRVQLDAGEAKKRVQAYASEQGIDARDAIAAIRGAISFPAVSLDAKGNPVPIQSSDDGFVMMFTEPSAEWLTAAAARIVAPFPAGLRTPVGIVVANPAYATDPALRALFTRDHYHGTVVWSWQQALLLSGMRRQMARTGLPEPTRRALVDAERSLRDVIDATASMRTSELWSFTVDAQGYRIVPFGQGKGHHTEANAAQLWSTVHLALDRPR